MKENRNKLFIIIIAALLLVNIILLLLFLQNKNSDRPHFRPDRKAFISAFLKKEIGFNDEQLAKFDTLSDNHRQKVAAITDRERTGKGEQFKQLVAGNFSDSLMHLLAEKSAATQRITDSMMFLHMKSIRDLCKPAQLPAFDSLFSKALDRRGADGKNKKP